MLLTAMAMLDVDIRRRCLLDRLRGVAGPRETSESTTIAPVDDAGADVPVALRAPSERNLWRWRRHPQLRTVPADGRTGAGERRARHSAVHGLYAAMAGDAEGASAWFLQAVSIHDIDLTELPNFWHMPRAAIEAAGVAYECVGRFREAATIEARLRTEFRPRNIVTLHVATDRSVAAEAAAL